jgi:hypothetical protein
MQIDPPCGAYEAHIGADSQSLACQQLTIVGRPATGRHSLA